MELQNMRGQIVWIAYAQLGGIWWNVGVFAVKEDGEGYLKEYWSTPDVAGRRVSPSTVM